MRKQSITAIWGRLLARVLNGRERDDAKAYLYSLGTELIALRESYKQSKVRVNYHDPRIIEAYLLAYYPHYAASSYYAFSYVHCETFLKSDAPIRVAFVGGGPLPELIGFFERLAECGSTQAVEAVLIDVNSATWEPLAEFSLNLIREIDPQARISLTVVNADISAPLSPANAALIGELDFVMLQNCLNEIAGAAAVFSNLDSLTDALRAEGILIVSDLHEYKRTHETVLRFEAAIRARMKMVRAFEPTASRSPFEFLPQRLFWDFHRAARTTGPDAAYAYVFPDGMIPRKNLNSSAAIWQKSI
ncbi:MAG: hypothetical protein NVSMB5_22890 [Candidatus Velthaea sp.]